MLVVVSNQCCCSRVNVVKVPSCVAALSLGGSASNNVAEYEGIRACFRDALAVANANPDAVVLTGSHDPAEQGRRYSFFFQTDSMLLARQLSGIWACRATPLRPLYEECLRIGKELSERGLPWGVSHIYREFNASADGAANLALDSPDDPDSVFPALVTPAP